MEGSSLRQLLISILLSSFVLTIPAGAQQKNTARPPIEKAGTVSAVVPEVTILRPLNASPAPFQASSGTDVAWNDLLHTGQQGRVRLALLDESVISLGSNSELRLKKGDGRSTQSALELGYSLIRMQIMKLLQGRRFELHTPTAIAGVVGTDFGADASQPGVTRFVCLAGDVLISNVDPKVPGTVVCHGGSTTSVRTGQAPAPPQPATEQQMDRWRHVTEPGSRVEH